MAITKTFENDKIEIVNTWNVHVRKATVIKEDGTELSRSFHRKVLTPYISKYNEHTKKWTHTDTDLSSEDSDVKSVCEAVWTDDVKANFKTWRETQI